jgi:hypothetical protein
MSYLGITQEIGHCIQGCPTMLPRRAKFGRIVLWVRSRGCALIRALRETALNPQQAIILAEFLMAAAEGAKAHPSPIEETG